MYEPMRKANRKKVWKSIEDPEAECIWNPQDDDDAQDEPIQATVQEEEPIHLVAEEFMEALDKPLTDDQAAMITNLFRSHACVLEWPAQHVTWQTHNVSLLEAVFGSIELYSQATPPGHTSVISHHTADSTWETKEGNENWSTGPEDCPESWIHKALGCDSATLYLVATIHYILKKMIIRSSNMKATAALFCVKFTGLHHCINGWKYVGGSKKLKPSSNRQLQPQFSPYSL